MVRHIEGMTLDNNPSAYQYAIIIQVNGDVIFLEQVNNYNFNYNTSRDEQINIKCH
jgi:hypothetical protein